METRTNPDGDQRFGFRNLLADCAAQIPADFPVSYKGEIDSHPYGIAVTGRTIYVADAGANSVVSVDAGSGKTRTVAVLPPVKLVVDKILSPTGLVLDEDGDMFVASLFGDGEVKVGRHSGKQKVVLAARLTADVDLRGGTVCATTNALPGEGAPDGNVVDARPRH